MKRLRYFTVIIFVSLQLNPGFCQDSIPHPAFSERIHERNLLVYRDVARYKSIDIHDSMVLKALYRVPRHMFMPETVREHAYLNTALPIGFGQTISQPVIVASMTQMLNISKGEKILEIGTGSGYQAAVLAELGAEVYSIEIVPELASRARKTLKELGYKNVHIMTGDGYHGWPEFSPYQKIIVTCAPEKVPTALVEQLLPEGKIVIPVGEEHKIQYLLILRKNKKGKLERQYKYPVRFVPMTGKARD